MPRPLDYQGLSMGPAVGWVGGGPTEATPSLAEAGHWHQGLTVLGFCRSSVVVRWLVAPVLVRGTAHPYSQRRKFVARGSN